MRDLETEVIYFIVMFVFSVKLYLTFINGQSKIRISENYSEGSLHKISFLWKICCDSINVNYLILYFTVSNLEHKTTIKQMVFHMKYKWIGFYILYPNLEQWLLIEHGNSFKF